MKVGKLMKIYQHIEYNMVLLNYFYKALFDNKYFHF